MSKLKTLTEDKYTLNDIFTKSSDIWLAIPLVLFLLTPLIHTVVFAVFCKTPNDFDGLIDYLKTGQLEGDYYKETVKAVIQIGALFGVVGVLSKIKSYRNEYKNKTDFIPILFFLLFIIIATISVIINHTDKNLILGYTVRAEGFITIIGYVFVFYFCGSMINSKKVKQLIISIFLLVGFILGIMVLIDEHVTEIKILNIYTTDPASVFYNINFYGYFLTMQIMLSAAVFLISKKRTIRIVIAVLFIMNSWLLSINNTLGCVLATIVAFMFLIVSLSIRNKKIAWQVGLLFAVYLCINYFAGFWYENIFRQLMGLIFDLKMIVTNDENALSAGTQRWNLWTHTISYIKEKPWIGYGFEGVAQRLLKDTAQDKVHNEYLEYAADFGVPAALLYIVGLISIYAKALVRKFNNDGLTFCCLVSAFAYIGSAFFGNTMIYIAPFFFIVLGLSNTTCKDENNNVVNNIST